MMVAVVVEVLGVRLVAASSDERNGFGINYVCKGLATIMVPPMLTLIFATRFARGTAENMCRNKSSPAP